MYIVSSIFEKTLTYCYEEDKDFYFKYLCPEATIVIDISARNQLVIRNLPPNDDSENDIQVELNGHLVYKGHDWHELVKLLDWMH